MKGKLIDAMSIIATSIITFGATAYAYSNRSTDDYAQKVKKKKKKNKDIVLFENFEDYEKRELKK